jgi:phosphatidylserine/phosphatidylglycerophosphate/cardiolipin synthase-like enzyme
MLPPLGSVALLLAGALGLASCTAANPSPAAPHSPRALPPTSGSPTSSTTPPTGTIGPVILEPDDGMTPVYQFIADAKTTLTMTMYELVDQRAEQLLSQDAARGVHVRVLLDSALENSRNQPAQVYLAAHGVIVDLAPASRITHQKTICINGDACLIMSLNMVADDYPATRDVAIEDSDPADVSAIETTFASDFTGTTDAVPPTGDHLLWSPGSATRIIGVINGARHSLAVENEEMDSTSVTNALVAAARRGVDVDVCMTADPAYRDALDRIMAAGGHVHLYPDRSGVLYIHEKLLLADAGTPLATGVAGSINFSTSSLNYNRELDIVLNEQDAAGPLSQLDQAFVSDFAGAPNA